MVNMTDIFGNALSIAGSFMDSDLVNRFMMVIFAVILVFGVLNCILGYRLLRFWMMLGGFLVGGGLALVVVHTMGIQEKSTMLIAALAAGVVFAVIAFLIYKAGVFILAAGIGWAASIYFLHPTSSAVFFACILIGVALGSMAVKYCQGSADRGYKFDRWYYGRGFPCTAWKSGRYSLWTGNECGICSSGYVDSVCYQQTGF